MDFHISHRKLDRTSTECQKVQAMVVSKEYKYNEIHKILQINKRLFCCYVVCQASKYLKYICWYFDEFSNPPLDVSVVLSKLLVSFFIFPRHEFTVHYTNSTSRADLTNNPRFYYDNCDIFMTIMSKALYGRFYYFLCHNLDFYVIISTVYVISFTKALFYYFLLAINHVKTSPGSRCINLAC